MKKFFKRFALFLLIAFIVIQFFRPERNIHTGAEATANSIASKYPVPENVKTILIKACNDCHSNNTVYPWYSYVQPVAWWLADHVNEGKRELNFDEFAAYRIRKQYKKLEEVIELVKENEMPLDSYTWIHKDAKLTMEEKTTITGWAEAIRETIKNNAPADSLAAPAKK